MGPVARDQIGSTSEIRRISLSEKWNQLSGKCLTEGGVTKARRDEARLTLATSEALDLQRFAEVGPEIRGIRDI